MPQALQLPSWVLFIRIAQAALAIITLVLTAFASSVFGVFSGFGLQWFVCFWTVGFLAFTVIFRPRLSNVNHLLPLIPEIATTFWWLVTLGLLASEATALNALQEIYDLAAAEAAAGDYIYNFDTRGKAALGCTKGAAVAAAIEFVSFLATTAIYIMTMMRAKNTGNPNISMNYTAEPKQNYPRAQVYDAPQAHTQKEPQAQVYQTPYPQTTV